MHMNILVIFGILDSSSYGEGWYCTSGEHVGDDLVWGSSGRNVTFTDWCDIIFRPYCNHPAQYPYIWIYKDKKKLYWMTNDGACKPICEIP